MDWHHLFIPHRKTHQKAYLISWQGLLVYILIFLLLKGSFSFVNNTQPGILGIDSDIGSSKIVELTNKEREKLGLPSLKESPILSQAARNKALNMFSENYWAHFAPSGKTPWDFISDSGYKFTFAGENLAKNFYTEEDAVAAWMASPSHKDNILNSRYQDIGIAVVDGVLDGQKTVLIVQMFGSADFLVSVPVNRESDALGEDAAKSPLVESGSTFLTIKPLIDPYQVFKYLGLAVMSMVSGLLIIDFIILRRRGVFRVTSHHFSHLAFLAFTATTVVNVNPGIII